MQNSYLINKAEIARRRQISELKTQLKSLNEDLLQIMAGVTIPNIEEKKAKFRRIHGDIRELEGKPRVRKNDDEDNT